MMAWGITPIPRCAANFARGSTIQKILGKIAYGFSSVAFVASFCSAESAVWNGMNECRCM
jgi:hypothetical protein